MRRFLVSLSCSVPVLFLAACTGLLGDFSVSTSPDSDAAAAEDGAGSPDSALPDGAPGCAGCGPHGACKDNVCVCETTYVGPQCSMCGPGFQDKDGDKNCSPDCSTMTCPPHGMCSDQSGTAMCVCSPGYTLSGSMCAWTGVVVDPTFEMKPTNAWAPGAGMTISPGAVGFLDRGWLDVSMSALCPSSGMVSFVSQKFDMPPAAGSEPLSLRVAAAAVTPAGAAASVTTIMGNAGYPLSLAPAFAERKYCLGEAQYGNGQGVRLEFREGFNCSSGTAYSLMLDHVSIDPDPSCPVVGTVVNGNFEAAGGWTPMPQAGSASIDGNVGSNASKGAHFTSLQTCQTSSMSGTWSPPSSMPSAALLLSYKGTSGRILELMTDSPQGKGIIAGNMTGNGGFQTVTVCVPEYAKGHVGSFNIHMPSDFQGNNSCLMTLADSRDYVVDDLRFATDAALCPAKAFVIDGGFERTDAGSPWSYARLGLRGYGGGPDFTTGQARSGTGRGRIFASLPGEFGSMHQVITVPLPTGATGPAISFFYRTEVAGGSIFRVSAVGTPISNDLTASTVWKPMTMCLPKNFAGRGLDLQFQVLPQMAGGNKDYLNIDDVMVVGSDPSCP